MIKTIFCFCIMIFCLIFNIIGAIETAGATQTIYIISAFISGFTLSVAIGIICALLFE